MTDAEGFRLELQRFMREEVPARVAEVQRKMCAELLTMVVQSTPVGNNTKWKHNLIRAQKGLAPLPKGYVGGHARKNWQVSVGASKHMVKAGVDKSGQQALTEGFRALAVVEEPTIVYIGNPLPYMQRLEEGWSKQAPTGMVGNAIRAITAKYARVQI